MARQVELPESIRDVTLDPSERSEALERLLAEKQSDATVVVGLSEQLDAELKRNDQRFVIYVLGAIRRIFDRRVVPHLISLLRRPVEITFRSQSIAGLSELYKHSITREVLEAGSIARQNLPLEARVSAENFRLQGDAPTAEDRAEIEEALHSVADDEEEVEILRHQAREAYLMCTRLSLLVPRTEL